MYLSTINETCGCHMYLPALTCSLVIIFGGFICYHFFFICTQYLHGNSRSRKSDTYLKLMIITLDVYWVFVIFLLWNVHFFLPIFSNVFVLVLNNSLGQQSLNHKRRNSETAGVKYRGNRSWAQEMTFWKGCQSLRKSCRQVTNALAEDLHGNQSSRGPDTTF